MCIKILKFLNYLVMRQGYIVIKGYLKRLMIAFLGLLLFTQCNLDQNPLPQEYNILRFKVDGEQMENPTECGEWLNGCDPITTRHGVERKGTLEFEGGDGPHGIYIYIYKKFNLNGQIILEPVDDLIYYNSADSGVVEFANRIDYNFLYTERNLEEGWIEGEFDFTVANNEGDTVEITDGYFKLTIDVY
jgi:hypothetical protein